MLINVCARGYHSPVHQGAEEEVSVATPPLADHLMLYIKVVNHTVSMTIELN